MVWPFLKFAPRKCADVRRALKRLGFEQQPTKGGTSHEQWEAIRDGHKCKVTVDCHHGEVKAKDVKSIVAQARVTEREFLDALNG